jgi:hypothetical protein
MATTFRADPHAAGEVSLELNHVRTDMRSMGQTFAGFGGATGSGRIEQALREFFEESSDNRESMDKLLERAAGMLRGLAEGTTSVDAGLAGALSASGSGQQGSPEAGGGR